MRRCPMPTVLQDLQMAVREREGRKRCPEALSAIAVMHRVDEASTTLRSGIHYASDGQMVDGLYELAAECIALIRILEAQ